MRMQTWTSWRPGIGLQLVRPLTAFPPSQGCPVLGLRTAARSHIFSCLQSNIPRVPSMNWTATCWNPSLAHHCSLCLHLLPGVPKRSVCQVLHALQGPLARPGSDWSMNELSPEATGRRRMNCPAQILDALEENCFPKPLGAFTETSRLGWHSILKRAECRIRDPSLA